MGRVCLLLKKHNVCSMGFLFTQVKSEVIQGEKTKCLCDRLRHAGTSRSPHWKNQAGFARATFQYYQVNNKQNFASLLLAFSSIKYCAPPWEALRLHINLMIDRSIDQISLIDWSCHGVKPCRLVNFSLVFKEVLEIPHGRMDVHV